MCVSAGASKGAAKGDGIRGDQVRILSQQVRVLCSSTFASYFNNIITDRRPVQRVNMLQAVISLIVSQRFYRVESGCLPGGIKAEEQADPN